MGDIGIFSNTIMLSNIAMKVDNFYFPITCLLASERDTIKCSEWKISIRTYNM